MSPITVDQLKELCPLAHDDILSKIVGPMNTLGPQFGVDTPRRWWYFLGQVAYESAEFTRLEENLWYHAPRIAIVWHDRPDIVKRADELAGRPEALGNAVYANMLGNGDEASGDGYRYRGRGLIEITGKRNYTRQASICQLDLVNHPELAAEPYNAVKIALAYWKYSGCNEMADNKSARGITRAINGPMCLGFTERWSLTVSASHIIT